MFKIQRADEKVPAVFALSGRIEGKHVPELESVLGEASGTPGTTLDMEEVGLVDREAVRFLGDCRARGISLKNCRPYILEWLEARSFAHP